jgi:hypothetical protein
MTPGRSDHAAWSLTALRLYLNSPPEPPKNRGQIYPNLDDYHSNPMEISSTFSIPDITNWWRQQEEHQQNVNRSGSHTQTSQTLPQTSPVLPSNSRFAKAPLELSKVLSDSARAFSGAPESTCSYGGAFRMPRDVTYRIVKFWSCRDLCAGLWET